MSNIASTTHTFVFGKETDGNRETVTILEGMEYDLPSSAIQYESNDTAFPYSA